MGSEADRTRPVVTVLVAERDAALRGDLVRTLEEAGFAVLETCDARGALHVLRTRPDAIDWLVTDVQLGDMSGVHVAFEYRFLQPTRPIIVISDFDMPAEINRISGAWVVRKPFGMSFLLDELNAAIASMAGAGLRS